MFVADFKHLFKKGLAALLPTIVTFALLVWAFNWIHEHVATPITNLIITFLPKDLEFPILERLSDDDPLLYGTKIDELDPETGRQLTLEYQVIHHPACEDKDPEIRGPARQARAEAKWRIVFAKFPLNVLGFLIAILLICVFGFFLTGLLGRTTLRMGETLLLRIPLIRAIYPNIKQVTDFLMGDQKFEFGGVVAVEYPRKGVWSIGLLTGPAMKTIQSNAPVDDLVTVFIPSSPTPVTGYTITVPKSEVIELAITIDEALRFTISGGVIRPPSEGGQPEMAMPGVIEDTRMLENGKNDS